MSMTQTLPAESTSTAQLLLLAALDLEISRAKLKHGPYRSAHEAYAVILEELDEFWDEVKKKSTERSPSAMLVELIQIAATALRAAENLHLTNCLDPATVGHLNLRLKGQEMDLMLHAPELLAAAKPVLEALEYPEYVTIQGRVDRIAALKVAIAFAEGNHGEAF